MFGGPPGGNDKDQIASFLAEQFTTVDPERGPVVLVLLMRHSASGDVEVHCFTAKQPASCWGKPDEMAEVYDAISRRDSAGITGGGAIQYSIQVVRENSKGKPCAQLPIIRSAPTHIAGANAGTLASEPPTAVGLTQQASRWSEAIVAASFDKDKFTFGMLAQLVSDTRKENIALSQENREWQNSMRGLIADVLEKNFAQRIELARFNRNSKLLMQATRYAPAAINQIAGRKIVPERLENESIAEIVFDTLSPEELAVAAAKIAERSPSAGAFFSSKMAEVKRRRAEDDAKVDELSREMQGATLEDAANDAAGRAIKLLRGKKDGETNGHANGHTNGTNGTNGVKEIAASTETKAEATAATSSVDASDVFGRAFIDAAKESDIAQLAGIMRATGKGDLADKMEAAFKAKSERGGAT